MALCPGLPGWAGTRKVKPIWILLKQETVSGSGISWTICKSASHSRQITTPAPHRSVFFMGRMPFLPPNQQHLSTEGTVIWYKACQNDWPTEIPVGGWTCVGLSPAVTFPNAQHLWGPNSSNQWEMVNYEGIFRHAAKHREYLAWIKVIR